MQRSGAIAEYFQRSKRAVGELTGDLARFFQADDGRIGGFLGGSVLAGRFAELLARLRDVEDVVDDLERKADVVAEFGEGLELRGGAISAHAAQPDRAAEQRRSFAFVDVFELVRGNLFALA